MPGLKPRDSGSVGVEGSLALIVVDSYSLCNSNVESGYNVSEYLWLLLLKTSVLECFHLQP